MNEMNLWTYYRRDEISNEEKIDINVLPKITKTPESVKILEDIDTEIQSFKRTVRRAV
jgi:hypothetical protein